MPEVFHDDLVIEFFGTGWDWLDEQIKNGINSQTNASQLNHYFYNNLYSTVTSQLKTAFGYNTNTPANRTFVSKFPQNGKMIIQKSNLDIGYNNAIASRTYDWGVELRFNAADNGNGCWQLSGGVGGSGVSPGNVLVRPKNLRVKMVGAAYKNGGWHGSKMLVDMQ